MFTLSFAHDYSVSIHAPAGGATGRIAEIMGLSKFQSTLPRGERLIAKDKVIRELERERGLKLAQPHNFSNTPGRSPRGSVD